jgi:hypothetical protein
MAKQRDAIDEIVDELVVFKHEDPNTAGGQYFSNNPMWNDSRIRERWMARYSDDALAEEEDDDSVIEDEEGDDYETWTNDELRTELVKRQLSVEGKKVDLVARLREYDDKAAPTQ